MSSFIIQGGKTLSGEVIPQGAKNEALQILCAVLLTSKPVTISNLPDIVDVNKLIDLLSSMGVKTVRQGPGAYRFQADEVNLDYFKTEEFSEQESSLPCASHVDRTLRKHWQCHVGRTFGKLMVSVS